MGNAKENLVTLVYTLPGITEDQLRDFLSLLNVYESHQNVELLRVKQDLGDLLRWKESVGPELHRLRSDSDGLEDFASLQEDAAEVVRQWTHGSTGMLDEACGRLRDNGRDGWWRGSPTPMDPDPE